MGYGAMLLQLVQQQEQLLLLLAGGCGARRAQGLFLLSLFA